MSEIAIFVVAVVAVLALVWFRKKTAKIGGQNRVTELRQNLRVKVFYDEAKIERLIEFERNERARRGQKPADMETLLTAAVERWERDNRNAAPLY